MCKHCLEQYEDEELAYTLMPENRLTHPAADSFLFKFCSRAHLQGFLELIRAQQQRYILTRVVGDVRETLPPAEPLDILLRLGSM